MLLVKKIFKKSISFFDFQNIANDECNDPEKGKESHTGKNFLIRLVSEVESPDLPISPLAMTPERSPDSENPILEPKDKTPSPEPCSPKLRNLSQKLKGLSKMVSQYVHLLFAFFFTFSC